MKSKSIVIVVIIVIAVIFVAWYLYSSYANQLRQSLFMSSGDKVSDITGDINKIPNDSSVNSEMNYLDQQLQSF